MHLPTTRIRRLMLAAAVAALPALLAPAGALAAGEPTRANWVKVMTRNIYLGGDIGRPIRATVGCPNQAVCLTRFGNANHRLAPAPAPSCGTSPSPTPGIVDETEFTNRAQLLAREIATHEPDVVGLQEVAKWSCGPLELDKIATPNAGHVQQDFLAILLDALADQGQDYEPVVIQQESDVEGPAFTGSFPASMGNTRDVRLTMHDVILRRDSSDVQVEAKGGGHYDAALVLPAAGIPFEFTRGFGWADMRVHGRRFRFVNTHLEAFSSDIALAQAQEAIAGPAAPTDRDVILLGDFNSDPANHTVKDGQTVPHSGPYTFMTTDGGFTDAWPALDNGDPGFTSGFNEQVLGPLSAIDHRIDLVLVRPASPGAPLKLDRGWIVGTDPEQRTAAGRWPSDHAGVVVKLRP